MSILTLENVSRDFDGTPLFQNVTFGIEPDERVGLIGANGSGKSTLLRMIVGEEEPDTGRIYRSGDPVVGYLSQNPPFDPERTVLDTIFSSNDETLSLIRDYEEVCERLAHENNNQEELLARMNDLSSRMDAAGAWNLETEAKIILDKLGIADVSIPVGQLSGGQRKRVAMAHALIERPDLLILDEPTNHLDADTIGWLEEFLQRYSGALLLVTHDRYFLERVTDRIVEIARRTVRSYNGNYSYYLEKKEEEGIRQEVEEHKLKMLAREELAWLRSGAKARRTKQKARVERATELVNREVERPQEKLDIAIGSRRLGSKILELRNVSKSYGEKRLLQDFTHVLQPGERLGIIGQNGAGKTTLLEMILGNVEPDSGELERGETVVIGYYDQESRALEGETRVIDYIKEIAERVTTSDGGTITASQMLERFLFSPSTQYNLIGNLSGGEKRRLYLLRVLMGGPNLLILDEPTNDLDIPTLQALESYLDEFDGCTIIVSHDRYFLDRTIDHLFRFEGEGKIREYPGNYSAFLDIREREDAEGAEIREQQKRESDARRKAEEAELKRKNDVPSDEPRKLSYKEQKELSKLEEVIAQTESEISEVETALATADYTEAQPLAERLNELNARLETDFERWSELEARR